MIISILVTTFLLSCIYLRFLDSMFRFELWGQVRITWQTATELDRPWQTLADLGLPSRNKPSRYGHTPSCVNIRSVTFCHFLLRSPRSTTAHSVGQSRRDSQLSRQPTSVDPVPLRCVTICRGRRGYSVNVAWKFSINDLVSGTYEGHFLCS